MIHNVKEYNTIVYNAIQRNNKTTIKKRIHTTNEKVCAPKLKV